jgi:hypothetical protein
MILTSVVAASDPDNMFGLPFSVRVLGWVLILALVTAVIVKKTSRRK